MSEKSISKQILQGILIFLVISALLFGVRVMVTAYDRGYLSLDNALYNTSEIEIEVYSNHIIYNANYTLYIDGEAVEQFSMKPGEYTWILYEYKVPKSDGSYNITVKVVSTGGGLGSVTDESTILVGTGHDYKITLYA